MSGLNRSFLIFISLVTVMSVSGCDLAQNFLKADRAGGMEIQNYRDGLAQRQIPIEEDESAASTRSSIPALQPYVASGAASMKTMPLVSISVNQSVPLRDVLFELAQQADYDLELDPRIRGSIIFTARERPFDQVVERISEMAGLRYKFKEDVLRVELDTPYNKTYKIDYLSYIRTNTGSIRNNVSVVSGDGADSGSAFEASTTSEADFWAELDGGLQQILGGAETSLRTKRDPRITAAEQNADVAAVSPETNEDGETQVQVQAPQAVLRVDSLPLEDEDEQNGNNNQNDEPKTSFSINKQAGIVNVYASEKQQKEVQDYLELVRRSVTSQVLIEAKILEVSLNDQYATGIDWRAMHLLDGNGALNFLRGATGSALNSIGTSTGTNLIGTQGNSSFAVAYDGNDVQAVMEAISEFGTVRALASPRLTVLNNQSAVLNVATNEVYFEIDIDVTRDNNSGDTDTEVDTEIRNVPVGVLVNVIPSIDLERNVISLAVRPTITAIDDRIDDPGVAFAIAQCGAACANLSPSRIPQLNVQEIDSVIQVDSGSAVIMGGLLQDKVTNSENGVPVLNEVPMVGNLFKQHQDQVNKTELVIFLKATILGSPSDSVHNTDKDLYRKFAQDRRPFKM